MTFLQTAAGEYVGGRVIMATTRAAVGTDIPPSPTLPFIQFSFGNDRTPTFRSVGNFSIQEVFVDFIEKPGSMHRADFVLDKIRSYLTSQSAKVWPSGQFVYEVKWAGRSADMPKEDDSAVRRFDIYWIQKGSKT